MKHTALAIAFLFILQGAWGQSKYWVFLTDKEGVEFHPREYFSQKAIERRKKHNLPLDHYTDYPVKATYQQEMRQIADSVHAVSRWFNAVACSLTPEQRSAVRSLEFVREIRAIRSRAHPLSANAYANGKSLDKNQQKLLRWQTKSLEGRQFRDRQLKGKGVRIAVFDVGFPDVNEHPAFQHLHANNRIIATKDFSQGDENVYAHYKHGTMVLSCIAGKYGDTLMGMAPGAEFLLARTERLLWEWKSEEENWVAAMEWADRKGADIINSSLGYVYHRYFKNEMDGKTSLVARAARMAARKGILVVNSAGNSGSGDWKIINTPADADSILTIGGISPWSGYHAEFSSYGPTADHDLKPNVSAYGFVIAAEPGGYTLTQGTSFSSPLVAGFAACVLQQHPGWTCQQLIQNIEQSGHLAPYYDYAHGYGIPQATYFTGSPDTPHTFKLTKENQQLKVKISEPYFTPPDTTASEEEETNLQFSLTHDFEQIGRDWQHLYFHIRNQQGSIKKYYVIQVNQQNPITLDLNEFQAGQLLHFYYKGDTQQYKIQHP